MLRPVPNGSTPPGRRRTTQLRGGRSGHGGCTILVRLAVLLLVPMMHHGSNPRAAIPLGGRNNDQLSIAVAEALAPQVRLVRFSSRGYHRYHRRRNGPTQQQQNKEEQERGRDADNDGEDDGDLLVAGVPTVVFLHGRLEAEANEAPFPAPAELYFDFCCGLVERMAGRCQKKQRNNDNDNKNNNHENDDPPPRDGYHLLMVEYDDLLSGRGLSKEPRDLSRGAISSALAEAISTELLLPPMAQTAEAAAENNKNHRCREQQQQPQEEEQQQKQQQVVLVTFSMGAAMALKLLSDSNALQRAPTHVVLIEPVWRCWLSLAVSDPRPIFGNGASPVPRILALRGTRDDQTDTDSGGSVGGSLRPFLPEGCLEVVSLEGGNHWGILSESAAGEIAREGLLGSTTTAAGDGGSNGGGVPTKDVITTPERLRTEMIDAIAAFCGWNDEEEERRQS